MLSIVSSAEPEEVQEEKLGCVAPCSMYLCVSCYLGLDAWMLQAGLDIRGICVYSMDICNTHDCSQ